MDLANNIAGLDETTEKKHIIASEKNDKITENKLSKLIHDVFKNSNNKELIISITAMLVLQNLT